MFSFSLPKCTRNLITDWILTHGAHIPAFQYYVETKAQNLSQPEVRTYRARKCVRSPNFRCVHLIKILETYVFSLTMYAVRSINCLEASRASCGKFQTQLPFNMIATPNLPILSDFFCYTHAHHTHTIKWRVSFYSGKEQNCLKYKKEDRKPTLESSDAKSTHIKFCALQTRLLLFASRFC